MALQVLAREVKALRKQLETAKQQASAKEAEHAAREAAQVAEHKARAAELAARQAELAAAVEVAQAAASSHRENQPSFGEDADADTPLASPIDTDAVEPAAPKEAEAAASATARPDVVEAGASHEAADEAECASSSGGNAAAAGGDSGGGGSGGDSSGNLPHNAVPDTAAASDPGPSVLAPTSYKQLLQEVAALRQRLHDSSFEVVAGLLVSTAHSVCFG